MRRADPALVRLALGITRPRQSKAVFGSTFSGTIEAVSDGVTRFNANAEVFGTTDIRMGAHAEFVVISEHGTILSKPANLSHEQAAAIPFGFSTALYFLRKARLSRHERLLVVGASGALGTAAVQLGKHFGAHVTGVCGTKSVTLVQTLGADEVADYTDNDSFATLGSYDVIFDTVGALSLRRAKRLLSVSGRYASAVLMNPITLGYALLLSLFSKKTLMGGMSSENLADLELLAILAKDGVIEPFVSETYALADISKAYARVDSGHKRGNIALQVV